MSGDKKIKVTDLASLQLEKQRLKAICGIRREKLEAEWGHFRQNYPELVMKVLLPFNDDINDKIFRLAQWINTNAVKLTGGSNSKFAQFLSGKGGNALQAALIYLVVKIGKTIFLKKK